MGAAMEPGYRNNAVRVASGLNILLGIWVIISPWVYGHPYSVGSVWNSVIVGILIVIFAAIRFSGSPATWPSWLNVLLGIWLIISPWIYGYAGHNAREWNSIIFGIICIILAAWSAAANRPAVRV